MTATSKAIPAPKNFYMMVLGQIISILGSALLRFALSLYVLDTTGDESLFATLYAISNIPLLLSPLGGAIADRFNRRNLMVIFDFSSNAIVLGLILLMGMGSVSVFAVGAVMVLLSVISSMYTPAVTASIPQLVEEHKLAGANGLVQGVQALSAVAAPVLGGILYDAMGVQAIVILSGVSFFLSAIMEIFIRIPFEKRAQTGHIIPTITKDMKDGFSYVMKQRFILKAGVIAVLLNLVLSPYFLVGAPIVLRFTMQSSDKMYGIGMGLINFATILGALSIGFFTKFLRLKTMHRGILAAALLTVPMAVAVMPFMLERGFIASFVVFMVGAIPIAACMTIFSLYIITKVQTVTPNENLGKVMAILMAVAQCAAPLGQILYGVLFKALKTSIYVPTFLVGAATLLIALLTQRLLKNEREPGSNG